MDDFAGLIKSFIPIPLAFSVLFGINMLNTQHDANTDLATGIDCLDHTKTPRKEMIACTNRAMSKAAEHLPEMEIQIKIAEEVYGLK